MRKLRIGLVGLGSIAQKVYLPILSKATQWEIIGAFTPNQQKGNLICSSYRIPYFDNLASLAKHCDAIFVHSATSSHFEVINYLLNANIHVYVDKPLTEDIQQSEALIELAIKKKKKLMVGFNRRFAPFYQSLKQQNTGLSSLRIEKHRCNSIGPNDTRFTLLDDYLHVVDTALWIAGSQAKLVSGSIIETDKNCLFYAEHHLQVNNCWVTTSMHRKSGSQQEQLTAIYQDVIHQITNMNTWHSENSQSSTIKSPNSWDSILLQRGFIGAVEHFIDCVNNDTAPITSGEQAIISQLMIEKMLANR
ncbi:Gfo/Idh/MocA family protein [Proteus myxofaciens]|uniref:MviM family virulence factor n=1 Tax=Proteus myxofaciens ATCC 19692 TaxID=1354337 RepID=A0A198GDH7_9GAMM|nr:Gfo/Idh/MocA family oxidoreductase [Proteus myxofaciens]OAT35148.1 MviM family virulence factor [Proteus myxofaciens ATCC 19692]